MNRRSLLKGALMGASALVLRPAFSFADEARDIGGGEHAAKFAALERQYGGRLGVSILDTGKGHRIGHRADERFLMCSTFKLVLVAAVLARVDHRMDRLDRRIVFGPDVVLSYAPVTSKHVGEPGMTVAELCQAAITLSDNTAANLLLTSVGGPAAVTTCLRQIGDQVTRLDRTEPTLNVGSPGDLRDTTTPNAMLETMRTLLLGTALSEASCTQLAEWLRATSTGLDKLRAGVPAGWIVGDKTGSGSHGETNDIAIIWPPQRKPLLVTTYYAGSTADAAGRSAVFAEVGRIAAAI
ncbi:MAG: class A beta-lactamase [Rhodanobacter sp.]